MKLNGLNSIGAAALFLLGGFAPSQASADENVATGWLGGYSKILRATNFTGTASVSDNGPTGAYSASASNGRSQLRAFSFYPGYPVNYGYSYAGGYWTDTVTIQPDNPALLGTPGTAVFTYYLNGSVSSSDYSLCQFDVSTECECGGPSTYLGTPIVSSFTVARGFTFGSPLGLLMNLGANVEGSYGPQSIEVSLTAGGIAVTDNAGNPAAYTSTSSTGSARSIVLTNGDSYAGFGLTNTVGNRTKAALLAGNAPSPETLLGAFTGSHGTSGLVSDVMDFSGTDTNLFALQMGYDPAAAIAQLGNEANTVLQYFHPVMQIWTNAVYGNSDGGATNHFFAGAFDPDSLFQLGNWGVDTLKHVVWAVLDHNSRFAAGGMVATPVLRCTGITPQTNGVSLSLQGPTSGQYFIDQSPDLSGTNWSNLGRAVPDINGAATFKDSTPVSANQQRFYRARQ